MIHLDFETRSAADLKEVGAYRYAADPSTRILMAGISEDDGEVFLWVNPDFRTDGMEGDREADELIDKANTTNTEVYAHSAPFEAAMTWGKGATCGFNIYLPLWRCTAAMARKAGLPSSLEKCAEALGLDQQKDKGGAALIRFFSVPKKDGTFNEPRDFPDKWRAFGEYCKQDVRTEKAIHKKLKAFELRDGPLETFLFDLRMNERGIPVNVPALRNAQKIITEVEREVGAAFRELTGLEPGQRAKVLALLQSLGCKLDDMQADTLDEFTAPNPQAARVIELYRKTSYAATAKVAKMLECVCPDGRIRGTHLYYGASTGRWSGRLIQPQNFKKPPRWMKGITDDVFLRICRGITAEEISLVYGDPMEAISGVIRNFIGNGVLDGDYNAIEGRVACWRAGQKDILKDWADGKDLYLRAVAFVYDEREETLSKKDPRRDFGKVTELACFGPETLVLTKTGLKPIGRIASSDLVWDGLDWVKTEGVIYRGCKNTQSFLGVSVTPDHLVWCGDQFRQVQEVSASGSMTSRALEVALGSIRLLVTNSESEGAASPFWRSAIAGERILSRFKTSLKDTALNARSALGRSWDELLNSIGVTRTFAPAWRFDAGCSIVSPLLSFAATPRRRNSSTTTEVAGFRCSLYGAKTAKSFSGISSLLLGMTTRVWRWTESTWTRVTSREIFDLSPSGPTSRTAEPLLGCSYESSNWSAKSNTGGDSRLTPCYDLLNAGPRNRFTIWTERGPLIVHNCQYGLGVDGFIRTCANWGITVSEEIAHRAIHEYYRPTHRDICARWYQLDSWAREAIAHPGADFGPLSCRVIAGIKYLLLKLPSGRSLAFPHIEINRREPTAKEKAEMAKGKTYHDNRFLEITFYGNIAGNTWGRVKLHGALIFQNEIQAIAADLIAHGSITAEKRGCPPFMLVHDQALAEKTTSLATFIEAFTDLPVWAKGLPLAFEAKEAPYYKK